MYDVAVIGGGAAGFFAALRAASLGASVVIIEKSGKLLSKVRVSGGGRCNVTHNCFDPSELIRGYPRGSRELLGPFTRFGPSQVIDWFLERGVRIKSEGDGRMFPVTDSSLTIINCFLNEAERLRAKIITSFHVEDLRPVSSAWRISSNDGRTIDAFKLIVATGGISGGHIPAWLTSLGHHIVPPVPSLFTFNIPENRFEGMQGLVVQDARVRIPGTRFDHTGPLLFTHWGLSGPVILRTSAWAARYAHEANYDFEILVSFTSVNDEEDVRILFRQQTEVSPSKLIVNTPLLQLPSRLWSRICSIAGIKESTRWGDLGKSGTASLVNILLQAPFRVKGKTTFKEEFVTCGGIELREVSMKTMESKKHPGLFLAGEILDIDGVTGGYNFQAAWTTGWLAGSEAAEK